MMYKREVDCVIVGSDFITSDGYVANKIGTYQIAQSAKAHGIPFYVYGGLFDFIPRPFRSASVLLETRKANEIFTFLSVRPTKLKSVTFYNPAFDITPPDLISAIITPHGIVSPYDFSPLTVGKVS
jgi:methylthioribose-1-phosphate isomerase